MKYIDSEKEKIVYWATVGDCDVKIDRFVAVFENGCWHVSFSPSGGVSFLPTEVGKRIFGNQYLGWTKNEALQGALTILEEKRAALDKLIAKTWKNIKRYQ